MKKAFTLVELIVSVLIISLILSVGTYSFLSFRKSNLDKSKLSEIKELQLALESYRMIEGSYPAYSSFNPGQRLVSENGLNVFLDKIPEGVYYYYNSEFDKYRVSFKLETEIEGLSSGYNCASVDGIVGRYCCPSDLVAYWRAEGNALDSYKNNLHGNYIGTSNFENSVGHGASFYFNGLNSYVEVSNSDILNVESNNKTFSLWLRADDISLRSGILYKGVTQQFIEINGGRISGYLRSSSDSSLKTIGSSYYPENGEVLHVALVVNFGDRIDWYINGSFVNSVNISNIEELLSSNDFRIGYSYADRYFKGLIDEVMIFNRALQSYEVEYLYDIKHPCYFN